MRESMGHGSIVYYMLYQIYGLPNILPGIIRYKNSNLHFPNNSQKIAYFLKFSCLKYLQNLVST